MILVVAEQKDGTLNRASWEAVAAAQQMGDAVTIVLPGASVSSMPYRPLVSPESYRARKLNQFVVPTRP